MKSAIRILFPVLVILSSLLIGCRGAGPTATPTVAKAVQPPATTPQTEACAAGAGQTIEMWSPLTGPDGDEMSALAARFSQENPYKITVKHVAQPEYVQKLNAAAAANKLPAMTVVRAINVGELAKRNVLKPMSAEALSILGADSASQFPAPVWAAGEYQGQRYSFPLDMHVLVMYYNKDLFRAAGVPDPGTTPWTRQQFEAALEKLQSDQVQAIAIGTAFQGATLFQTLIKQFGGALTDDAGATATYNSPAGVQALTYINELKQKYSPSVSGAGDPEVNLFKQGKAAIVIHGPWHISDLQKLPFVGFAPIPQVGDEFAVWSGSHQLGLTTADPAQQAAAACWIKWLSENSLEWAKAGQVPARNSVRLSEDLKRLAAPIAAVAPSADKAILLPPVPELEGALWGEFGPVVDGVLMGEVKDVKAALDQAVAKSQQIMDENKKKYQ